MPLSSNTILNKNLSTKEKMSTIFRALSSKESLELGETSFRVYYGTNGATIPFRWESQPGTPKHPILKKNDNITPPLTPPPSYSLRAHTHEYPSKKGKKNMVFHGLFSSFVRSSRSYVTPTSSLPSSGPYLSPLSSSSSSLSTTSSSSSQSSPRGKCNNSHKRGFSFCSPMEKFSLFDKEKQNNVEFLCSYMCFGFKKQQGQGCYSLKDMKNALFLCKGH